MGYLFEFMVHQHAEPYEYFGMNSAEPIIVNAQVIDDYIQKVIINKNHILTETESIAKEYDSHIKSLGGVSAL